MVKLDNRYIQRIERSYVGQDCVQLMFPFEDYLKIERFGTSEILFHYEYNGYDYVNNYVKDERRLQFPYSNIPMHVGYSRLKKYTYVNQLLEFDKIYVITRKVHSIEHSGKTFVEFCKVVKDKDEAILVRATKISPEFDMTVDELRYNLISIKEPKITRCFNKGLKKEEIIEQKKLVKSLKKH